jgi:acetyltransferase-like isoleucine patch superfamily enzyme
MDGFPESKGDIVVEDGAWVAHGALVLSGVRIGRGAIVAAGAVVAKDVPPYWIVGGNPAVPIRQRVDDDAIAAIEASRWWERDRDEIVRTVDELNGEVPDRAALHSGHSQESGTPSKEGMTWWKTRRENVTSNY